MFFNISTCQHRHVGSSSSSLLFCEHALNDALDMCLIATECSQCGKCLSPSEHSMDTYVANWLVNVRMTYRVILAL